MRLFVCAFFLAAGAMALSGCQQKILPPCPAVRVDSSTANLVKFRDGDGRTPGDVAYEIQMIGYGGECDFRDDGVNVSMDLDFIVSGGPATSGGRAEAYYFVAIPQYYPQPTGKKVFRLRTDVPRQPGGRETFSESGIDIFIPLKPNEPAAAYDIYVGFQLTGDQLEFNRQQRGM
ncbi:MAG: hypothetical protein KDE14_13275 [Rhodobacteraceae bacterium]|nr:hypothetical protein [Paracoccaceae bacterium]